MTAVLISRDRQASRATSPFDLDDDAAYRRWRAVKLAVRARSADELVVDVADPLRLSGTERAALLERCARWNMAIYRGPARPAGGVEASAIARAVGTQLGLARLDANWLADEDGVSRIAVGPASRGDFIPYTDRPIQWHTDGYYHPDERRIRAMVLHCVRPAREGGVNALLDHELAYISLRDESTEWVRALMASDAMTIPAREGDDGRVERAAQSGPVFSVDVGDGALHMRYTARTRSIVWRDDAATHAAVEALARLLGTAGHPWVLRARLEPGCGLVANNVLHDRSGFVDDPAAPRLLLRARYLDRIAIPEPPWRIG